MNSNSLFLFIVLLLINHSSCKLNLFRPFAIVRQAKSATAALDLQPAEPSKLASTSERQSVVEQPSPTESNDQPTNKQPSDEEQSAPSNSHLLDDEQLSLCQFLSRKISQAINEIEMKLEDQLMNNKVNESQFEIEHGLLSGIESPAAAEQRKAKHGEPVRPATVGSATEIGSSASEINENQLDVKTEAASIGGSFGPHNNESSTASSTAGSRTNSKMTGSAGRTDDPAFARTDNWRSATTSNSTSTPPLGTPMDHALGEATNELSVKELTGLRSLFRTFGSVLDFLINAFDEFAEAIVSRSATLLINSFFDRASLFLLGI